MLRNYEKGKKLFDLSCKFYKDGYLDVAIPFTKRKDVLPNGFEYYNTTTQKKRL